MFHMPREQMQSHAAPLQGGVDLRAIFEEQAQPKRPFDEIGPAMTQDQIALLNTSGNKRLDERIHIGGNPFEQKNKEEEKQKELLQYARTASTGIKIITVEQAVNTLTDYSERLRSFSNVGSDYFLRPLDDDDYLRIKDGRIITAAEDPEGRYIVRTSEEKAAFEEANSMCVGGLAMDEVMRDDNGNMVNAKEFLLQTQIDQRIEEVDQAAEDLRTGKVTVEDLPDDIQSILENGDEGLLPPTPQEEQRAPEPVAANTLIPPSLSAPAPSAFS